ncbi:MAG: TSUP family transporter, partial [Desulfobacterales bacterium]|nr:TSUP family transporter [Desulfobacterales bacterium]
MESYGPWKITFTFQGKTYSFRTMPLGLLSFCVGIVGGTYGIGGGALVAPFCVTVLGLPVYTIAGATLLSTFIASIAGVFFYSVLPS